MPRSNVSSPIGNAIGYASGPYRRPKDRLDSVSLERVGKPRHGQTGMPRERGGDRQMTAHKTLRLRMHVRMRLRMILVNASLRAI
jgi:hypothetical protein